MQKREEIIELGEGQYVEIADGKVKRVTVVGGLSASDAMEAAKAGKIVFRQAKPDVRYCWRDSMLYRIVGDQYIDVPILATSDVAADDWAVYIEPPAPEVPAADPNAPAPQ